MIGATTSEGRTCCNCVGRVTGSEAGYTGYACVQCKARRKCLAKNAYLGAGFEVGMSLDHLMTDAGKSWLLCADGPLSGPEWLLRAETLNFESVPFSNFDSFLPQQLATYVGLISIDVTGNMHIDTVPLQTLAELPNLRSFTCRGCPRLLSPPSEIAELGGLETLKFIREIVRDGVFNKSMQLFLIGDGESGKTSLIRALMSSSDTSVGIHRDDRTVGIDIHDWDLRQDDVHFLVYDMAGQDIYKDSHTFFVGRRALYMFVWRLRGPSEWETHVEEVKDMIASWIQSLRFRVPGASVLSIATHAEKVVFISAQIQIAKVQAMLLKAAAVTSDAGIPLNLLNSGVSIMIDSINGAGVQDARKSLISFAKALPWYNEPIPKSWRELMSTLASQRERCVLKWLEYEDICSTCGIRDTYSITAFLHETGKIRYFGALQSSSPQAKLELLSELDCCGRPSSTPIVPLDCDDVSTDSHLLGSESGYNALLQASVFISPAWICNVMKGIICHDQTKLYRYFYMRDNLVMARRVTRLVFHGLLHPSLIGYIWYSSLGQESDQYWLQKDAADNSGDILLNHDMLNRAISMLIGFDLIVMCDEQYFIPSLLRPSQKHFRMTDGISSISCTLSLKYVFDGDPPGMYERLSVKIKNTFFHTDIGTDTSVFYNFGNVGQLFRAKGTIDTIEYKVRASSRDIINDIQKCFVYILRFYPGLNVVEGEQKLPKQLSNKMRRVSEDAELFVHVVVLASKHLVGETFVSALCLAEPALIVRLQCEEMWGTMSPYRSTRMVVLCIDKHSMSSPKAFASTFQQYVDSGCLVIPVLLPGYKVSNYEEWWPSTFPSLSSFTLFMDFRTVEYAYSLKFIIHSGKITSLFKYDYKHVGIKRAVAKLLVPQVKVQLNEWRGYLKKSGFSKAEQIPCPTCLIDDSDRVSYFERSLLVEIITVEMRAHPTLVSQHSMIPSIGLSSPSKVAVGKEKKLSAFCKYGHECAVEDLLAKTAEKKDLIPCEFCVEESTETIYYFDRAGIISLIEESNDEKTGLVTCPMCLSSQKILDLVGVEVFVSYNWGLQNKTQGFVQSMGYIEAELDIFCWLDVGGGLKIGQDLIQSMMDGVAKCPIFLVFLSDSYVKSRNCQREFMEAFRQRKYVIPVLLPELGILPDGTSTGWSNMESCCDDSSWLSHLSNMCNSYHHPDDAGSILRWDYLSEFAPIDARHTDSSKKAEQKSLVFAITDRITTRIHRGTFTSSSVYSSQESTSITSGDGAEVFK